MTAAADTTVWRTTCATQVVRVGKSPLVRIVDRLSEVSIDPKTGVHVGMLQIGQQRLRLGIRPPDQGAGELPTLLLFNGIGANLELAGPMMSRLHDVQTLIFDVPGTGKSPPPKWPYRPFQLARLARKVLQALSLVGPVDVMGVSWGGGIAQQFAIQYPALVRRLILAATSMGAISMVPGHPRVLLKMLNPRRYTEKGYMMRVAPDLYGGDLRQDPEAIRLFTDLAKGGHPKGYRYQLMALLGWTSLPWLWRMRQLTLVLAGNDDPLVPLINARMHAWLLPNAKLHVFDDGHLFMFTRAEETAQAIRNFLLESPVPDE